MTRDDSDKNRGGGTAIQTQPFAGLKAVAFDLDSTLCTYPFSVEEVLRAALPRAGLESDALGDLAEAAEAYAGLWGEVQESLQSTERIRLHIFEQLLAGRGSDADVTRLSDAYGAVRDETGIQSFDGVAELLGELKERYPLGLLTNGPSDIQWEKIRALRFGNLFDVIVVAGDVGIYKPDVRVFEILLDRLGVDAPAALFVGDNLELDIVGAHRSGMRTAWIRRNGTRPKEGIAPDIELPDVTFLRKVLL